MTLLLIGGSWMQCCRYAKQHDLASDDWTFVRFREDVAVDDAEYVLIGTYESNPQWEAIKAELELRGLREHQP